MGYETQHNRPQSKTTKQRYSAAKNKSRKEEEKTIEEKHTTYVLGKQGIREKL